MQRLQFITMILFRKAEALSTYIQEQKTKNSSIGFVPTMGALHAGHLSLIAASKQAETLTVCSIFINPTQFTNTEDFKHYPVSIEQDIQQLIESGCDVLFLPSVAEIYPPGYAAKTYDLGNLETVLEGQYRPGHFQGVCQVVDRLLQIVQPTVLYLGQKDYQQTLVIRRLIHHLHKEAEIEVRVGATLREDDGLAMSSRNLRLNSEQRGKAPALYNELLTAKKSIGSQSIDDIKKAATKDLTAKGFAVDYFEIADAATLLPSRNGKGPQIALVAAYLDNIRLIDNLPLKEN